MFKRQYFFDEENNMGQLQKMVKILGSDSLEEYIEKFGINVENNLFEYIGRFLI